MMLKASIQHSDLASEELGELEAERAYQRLAAIDWPEELRQFCERFVQKDPVCPPGFYLARAGNEHMACHPASEGRFVLSIWVRRRTGLLFWRKRKQFALMPAAPGKVRELIAMFATADSPELMQALSREPQLDKGVVNWSLPIRL